MMKMSASVCVDAPVKKVWDLLSKLDGIQDWSGSIHRSYCEGDQTSGVNAVRVCELSRNVTIKETVIAWEEGRSFTYTGQGIPLLNHAQNTWSVEANKLSFYRKQRCRSKAASWDDCSNRSCSSLVNARGASLWRHSSTLLRMAGLIKEIQKDS